MVCFRSCRHFARFCSVVTGTSILMRMPPPSASLSSCWNSMPHPRGMGRGAEQHRLEDRVRVRLRTVRVPNVPRLREEQKFVQSRKGGEEGEGSRRCETGGQKKKKETTEWRVGKRSAKRRIHIQTAVNEIIVRYTELHYSLRRSQSCLKIKEESWNL